MVWGEQPGDSHQAGDRRVTGTSTRGVNPRAALRVRVTFACQPRGRSAGGRAEPGLRAPAGRQSLAQREWGRGTWCWLPEGS